MHAFSRMVGILLLVAFAASSAGAQAFLLPAAQMQPAGCHGHALPVRAPAPASHECCVAGHNHAIPGSLFSGLTLLPYSGPPGGAQQTRSAERFNGSLSILIPSSLGSPGLICLRI